MCHDKDRYMQGVFAVPAVCVLIGSSARYNGSDCLMRNVAPFLSENSASGMTHWLHDARGCFGQYLYNLPETMQLRIKGFDGTLRIWDSQTGEIIRRMTDPNNVVVAATVGSDGRDMVVGFRDGGIQLWRLDSTLEDLLSWIQANRYIPDLTCEQKLLYQLTSSCSDTTG